MTKKEIAVKRVLYKKTFPEKEKARIACQRFNKKKDFHRHHWSYNKKHYKDLVYLTPSDHSIVHRNMIYDQERMMYRDLSGVLLDSKKTAIKYYKKLGASPIVYEKQ